MDTAGKGLPLNFQGWFCAALKSVGAGLRSVGYAPLLFVAGFALRMLLSEVSIFWAAPCLVLQLEMVGFFGGLWSMLFGVSDCGLFRRKQTENSETHRHVVPWISQSLDSLPSFLCLLKAPCVCLYIMSRILSGVYMCVSRSVVSDSLQSHRLQPTRLLCPWNSPGKNTGAGCHSLLQGIFPTQGSNPDLLNCGQILYCLSHHCLAGKLHLVHVSRI